MPLTFLLLRTVNATVNVFTMKLNYSEPKIYTGGVDISQWSSFSSEQKKTALSKDWFVYFSFRNPETGRLKKEPFIKAGVNKLKTKRERYAFLKTMQQALLQLLQYGFNPYEDNTALEASIFSGNLEVSNKVAKQPKQVKIKKEQQTIPENKQVANQKTEAPSLTIAETIAFGLSLKVNMMNKNSFVQYKSRIGAFEKWLKSKELYNNPITFITKKMVIEYLNSVLQRTSARNRNNTRTDIASLFQLLEDNEIIKDNFVKKIAVLKSVPKRNKTYTPKIEKEIYEHMREVDPHLWLFVKFFANNFLRPIEVCRLRIGDIDIQDKKLYVKAKNKPVKIKIIPEILLEELPDLSNFKPTSNLFGRFNIGEEWAADVINKRNEFSKRFKVIKDHFELGVEYGLYSFRHTSITKLYRKFREKMSQHEAKSNLMPITGHSTMVALEKYLRDIDAELPEDYSNFLR
ncbi:site-specific integrase [Polaribacter litorisediminis]|nr:site-specific integrase [Polaribacter litorisediminis]